MIKLVGYSWPSPAPQTTLNFWICPPVWFPALYTKLAGWTLASADHVSDFLVILWIGWAALSSSVFPRYSKSLPVPSFQKILLKASFGGSAYLDESGGLHFQIANALCLLWHSWLLRGDTLAIRKWKLRLIRGSYWRNILVFYFIHWHMLFHFRLGVFVTGSLPQGYA